MKTKMRLLAGKVPVYILVFCIFLNALSGCALADDDNQSIVPEEEIWPEIPGPYEKLAEKSRDTYLEKHYSYEGFLPEDAYDPFGSYLNWEVTSNYSSLKKDPSGIVMIERDGEYMYNPCTISQYALHLYGKYLSGECSKWLFLHQVDFLLKMQEKDGSLRYYYDYPYYCMPDDYFLSGWSSAMTMGHLLSLCARAYHLTGDEDYEKAADQALHFLSVPVEEDGVMTTLADLDPSLSCYRILEEYPTSPATYTLNGFMFTLIGLYDWSCTDSKSAETASKMFDEGIKTLEKILPYYDIGGFTAYDLSHITLDRAEPHIGVAYHRYHVAFCKIFFDITGIDTFDYFYRLWASYVAEESGE